MVGMTGTAVRPDPPAPDGRAHVAARRGRRREWLGLAVLALADHPASGSTGPYCTSRRPVLSADLAPSSSQLLWIIDVYGFVVAGLLVTMGTVGDRIGRRRLLMIGAAGVRPPRSSPRSRPAPNC